MVEMMTPPKKYEEDIEIIPKLDGTLVAQVQWRGQSFQEALPRGIQTWTKAEFKAHLRRFVVPKLRLFVLKAQRQALDEEGVNPEDIIVTRELSSSEVLKMQSAEEKRQRKLLKQKNLAN